MTKPELKRFLLVFNVEIALAECQNTLLHRSLNEGAKVCRIDLHRAPQLVLADQLQPDP